MMLEFLRRLYREGWQADRAVRPIGRLMIAAMVVSCLYAFASVVLAKSLADFQMHRQGMDDGSLPSSAKTIVYGAYSLRVITVISLIFGYSYLVRRLSKRTPSEHRLLLSWSIFGVAAYSYLIFTPNLAWTHVVQGVQVALLLAVTVLLFTPRVRTYFTGSPVG
ncbi:Major facilitator superfamily MFS_1 [Rhodococcus sp. AW25M09]|uniref:hypothetical protein n=1 Tax=Rhodococcus sp. AW25M09 TaxID=1268303 RepID=UPI0002ACBE31|nr:hypothetical protein [Rhodococcus sp. AW25M09]CCQ17647.1 Major facilitator superfamily MFS_1 [Rhodococcus sp. AW25M09]